MGITWNPADKDPSFELAEGDLGFNKTGDGWASVRATHGVTTGKWYFTTVWNTFVTHSSYLGIGLASATADINTVPGDTQSMSFISDSLSGTLYYENTSVEVFAPLPVEGDTVCIAFDVDAKLMWFRVNNSLWNNDPIADPTTGAAGIAFSTGMTGMVYPAGTGTLIGDSMTANFGEDAFLYAAPTDFLPYSESDT